MMNEEQKADPFTRRKNTSSARIYGMCDAHCAETVF